MNQSVAQAVAQSQPVPDQGVAAGMRDRADPRLVLADRVEQLCSQTPIAIAASFVAGAIATVELWNKWLWMLVFFWWVLVVAFSVATTALLVGYRRTANKVDSADHWLRWIGISALANGACWGFAGAVFFPSLNGQEQVFLAFLFVGMASIGIPVYAASWKIFALYAGGILLPFVYVLTTFGDRLFSDIALLIPLFYAVCVTIAYRLNVVFDTGYRLRHAYGRLTEDYSGLNQRLEQQLVELGEARRQVEASGRKLTLFAERAPIAVMELDPDGTVREVNHAAELLFGYAAQELIGGHLRKLVLPKYHADFERQWAELVSTREPVAGVVVRNPRRDGIELVCDWSVTPLVNAEGSLIAIIAQGRDITAQLEAARMKKEFTSTLSHELRTPLTSIIGSLQLINSGVLGDIAGDVGELTTVAERNGQRLLDLINDILDIEKIESGKLTLVPEIIRVDELVRESIVLNKAFGDRFKVRYEATGGLSERTVNADRKRLLQVMTNLLSNAAKFSPEGEVVQVSTEDSGTAVRIAVQDRGSGIPENFRNRIFGRFTQADSTTARQKGGTGLGLAICKRLVEMMQGRIGFEDRAGGGTSFWFELPRH
ncbi:MAG TPA: PAS domain-containing sensor histidine kinase [Burkholderiales bacterium]|nr:PAS domain-containing sensor histidine kinase [Burkholderiales bacterium]